jgi:hypothetical protein
MDNGGKGTRSGGGACMDSRGAIHGILHKNRHGGKAFLHRSVQEILLQRTQGILQQLLMVMHRTFSSPSFSIFPLHYV